jgi:hypothetical protein
MTIPSAPYVSETDAQLRARREFNDWILTFSTTQHAETRRISARKIRAMSRELPWLADQLPDSVWEEIYCVRAARGTVAP